MRILVVGSGKLGELTARELRRTGARDIVVTNRRIERARALAEAVGGRAEPYQFAGITVLEYAGNDKFSYQEDVYNMKECENVMKEWFAAGGKF